MSDAQKSEDLKDKNFYINFNKYFAIDYCKS